LPPTLKRILNVGKMFKGWKVSGNPTDDPDEEITLSKMDVPNSLEEAVEKYPYLSGYISGLDPKPKYMRDLSLAIGMNSDSINVIYPVGMGIFIHVSSGREIGKYNVIEPRMPDRRFLEEAEDVIARMIDEKTHFTDDKAGREKVLSKLFWEAVKKGKLKIPIGEHKNVLYHFLKEKVGHGVIDDFLLDPRLEDISVPGEGKIYVYHRIFGNLESNIELSREDSDRLLRSLAERYGKVLSYTNPIIDIHLPDGSRFNIVFREDISLRGSNFTIRKFSQELISMAHLIRWGTISPEMAAYMWMLLEVGVSFFICGETASGKTTSLNAIAGMISPSSKIISIEETPEVNLPHKNWVREVTRMHTGSVVTKIYRLVQERMITQIFDCEVSSVDFKKAMDEGLYIIVNLAEGRITGDVANFLGSLILSLNCSLLPSMCISEPSVHLRTSIHAKRVGFISD